MSFRRWLGLTAPVRKTYRERDRVQKNGKVEPFMHLLNKFFLLYRSLRGVNDWVECVLLIVSNLYCCHRIRRVLFIHLLLII